MGESPLKEGSALPLAGLRLRLFAWYFVRVNMTCWIRTSQQLGQEFWIDEDCNTAPVPDPQPAESART
jgi:hypothetical protein